MRVSMSKDSNKVQQIRNDIKIKILDYLIFKIRPRLWNIRLDLLARGYHLKLINNTTEC